LLRIGTDERSGHRQQRSGEVAKWVLPETDSPKAQQLITQTVASGGQLIVLDLAFPEVANAIWKRRRQKLITLDEARAFLNGLIKLPVRVEPAARIMSPAFEIAAKYDRSVYDALFVALAQDMGLRGITADEPLVNVLRSDFPQIVLLRDL
jgi:predicted nucleic acid-binding protein